MFSHKWVVLVAGGERHEGLRKVVQNEVAEYLSEITRRCRHSKVRGDIKVFPVSGGIITSNYVQLGTLGQ